MISALADVGLETLSNELKSADLAGSDRPAPRAALAVPQAFSTMGASVRDLLFAPVLMLQYAIQFIQLAVPSSAARVALEVRFFQRKGSRRAALSIGLIDSVSGFVIQILLILIITLVGAREPRSVDVQLDSSSSSSARRRRVPACWSSRGSDRPRRARSRSAIPRYRNKIKEAIPRYRAHPGADGLGRAGAPRAAFPVEGHDAVPRQPDRQLMLAIILGICLRAFGERASFAGLSW